MRARKKHRPLLRMVGFKVLALNVRYTKRLSPQLGRAVSGMFALFLQRFMQLFIFDLD